MLAALPRTVRRRRALSPYERLNPALANPPRGAREETGEGLRVQTRQWAVPGSNQRPPACKAGALPTELTAQCPQRDSNPRYGLERAVTWAASRWGPAARIPPARRYTRRAGPVAQLVEQGTFNPKVEGSSPSRPIAKSPASSRVHQARGDRTGSEATEAEQAPLTKRHRHFLRRKHWTALYDDRRLRPVQLIHNLAEPLLNAFPDDSSRPPRLTVTRARQQQRSPPTGRSA